VFDPARAPLSDLAAVRTRRAGFCCAAVAVSDKAAAGAAVGRIRLADEAVRSALPATAEERFANHAPRVSNWRDDQRPPREAPTVDPVERANGNAAQREATPRRPKGGREILTTATPWPIVARPVNGDEPVLLDDEYVDAHVSGYPGALPFSFSHCLVPHAE